MQDNDSAFISERGSPYIMSNFTAPECTDLYKKSKVKVFKPSPFL